MATINNMTESELHEKLKTIGYPERQCHTKSKHFADVSIQDHWQCGMVTLQY